MKFFFQYWRRITRSAIDIDIMKLLLKWVIQGIVMSNCQKIEVSNKLKVTSAIKGEQNQSYSNISQNIFFYYYKIRLYPTQITKMKTTVLYIDDFKVLDLAGDGGQASVYLCIKNLKMYAIKVFNASMYKGEPFKRETKFLSLLQKHPNLIQMCEANPEAIIKYSDGVELKRSIIVLQFAQKGDLFEYIKATKGFKPQIARTLFISILDGIQHLHSIGVAHRDMKPENILFNENFELKLSDFGLSTFCEGSQRNFVLTTRVGTEGFKAPEVDSGEYNGEKADIFAIGVILFLLFAGSPPFLTTKSTDKMYKIIINKNFDKFWSIHEKNRAKNFFPPCFKILINSLLCSNPQQRSSISQIRDSQWLKMPLASNGEIKQELQERFKKVVAEFQNRERIVGIVNKFKQKILKEEVKNTQSQEQTSITKNPEAEDFLKAQQSPIPEPKQKNEQAASVQAGVE